MVGALGRYTAHLDKISAMFFRLAPLLFVLEITRAPSLLNELIDALSEVRPEGDGEQPPRAELVDRWR